MAASNGLRAVVIGGGASGTMAALELAGRGANVTVIVGPPGASQLTSGILDWETWNGGREAAKSAPDTAADIRDRVAALDAYALGDCLVATSAGVVRSGAGRDRALLDLASIAGREVLLPRSMRHGWDADALAWMFAASDIAVARGVTFRAVDATILRLVDERTIPDAAIAARHDDPVRLEWLADRLREAAARANSVQSAWLLPPWLGVQRERAKDLSDRVASPCGEVVVGLSGPSGFRFAAARDRAFAKANVATVVDFARSMSERDRETIVELETATPLQCDVVILATGGILAGGVVYEPSEASAAGELPTSPRPPLREPLSDALVGASGRPLDVPGSLFGIAPETLAWPWSERSTLEYAGVLVDGSQRVLERRRVFAAGDVVADRPRTWLEAARSGVFAARAALGVGVH